MEIRDRSHPENSTGWDVTSVHRDEMPVTAFYAPHPAVRDNLEAFGRAALGQTSYPVALDEMLANVRSFEAIHRSVKSGAIEAIECGWRLKPGAKTKGVAQGSVGDRSQF